MKKLYPLSFLILFTLSFNLAGAQIVSTFAGSTNGYTNGPVLTAQFEFPSSVCTDTAGNICVADRYNNRIRRISPLGIVTTMAGSTGGYLDGPDTLAQFNWPTGICVDDSNNLYVADYLNHKIRKINPAGVVSTLAGSTLGYADGSGASAQFSFPTAVCVDDTGNVYVADYGNIRIRKITPAGVVTTFAGSTDGFANGTGTAAQFSGPTGICADEFNNIYVTDYGNHRIRKITPLAEVTTFAGSLAGFGDAPMGIDALFSGPVGICSDAANNIYVTEQGNHKIRVISPATSVTTMAGSTGGYTDGPGATAQFNSPQGVYADAVGDVYVADAYNYKIRKITAAIPLPVSISNFNGQIKNNINLLSWITNNEKNNSGFHMQHSADGINFIKLGTINSKALNGNSSTKLTYDFEHKDPCTGLNYYRLEQVDMDGNYTYSKVVVLSNINKQLSDLTIFPNPCANALSLYSGVRQEINIFDIFGHQVYNTMLHQGDNELDLSSIDQGVFILKTTENAYHFLKE